MKKLFSLLIFFSLFFEVEAQAPLQKNAVPKLVVGIVVDQMRYDYIYKYWDKFGNDGFKRLVNEGFFCKNTNYNYVPTYTGPGHASIYTGAPPSVHGIVGNEWFDRNSKTMTYCAGDKTEQTLGNVSSAGQMSPRNMLSTSVCDELRLATNKKSKVIGIALKDRGAILPAGHSANAAYWFDSGNGSWVSSTYYMSELPTWVAEFNKKEFPKKYLSQPWTTLLPIEQYTESAADDNAFEFAFKGEAKPVFPHNLPELMLNNNGLGLLRSTPFGNSFTKDFAIETIKNEAMGKGPSVDFLAVSFSSPDYIGHQFGPQSVEVEDCYLRFDKDIAELLKFIDTWVGKNNALVFLTADHGAVDSSPYLKANNIPTGIISERAVTDSLKKFLQKNYNDSLGIKFTDFNIYLDRKKIEEKKLSVADVQKKLAAYFINVKGISHALTAENIMEHDYKDALRKRVQNGFMHSRSGDVIIVFSPGWLEGYSKGTTHGSPYSYDTHVPLIWWGANIKSGSSAEEVNITDIAPTISLMLNIQFPNGCTGKPIPFLVK